MSRPEYPAQVWVNVRCGRAKTVDDSYEAAIRHSLVDEQVYTYTADLVTGQERDRLERKLAEEHAKAAKLERELEDARAKTAEAEREFLAEVQKAYQLEEKIAHGERCLRLEREARNADHDGWRAKLWIWTSKIEKLEQAGLAVEVLADALADERAQVANLQDALTCQQELQQEWRRRAEELERELAEERSSDAEQNAIRLQLRLDGCEEDNMRLTVLAQHAGILCEALRGVIDVFSARAYNTFSQRQALAKGRDALELATLKGGAA